MRWLIVVASLVTLLLSLKPTAVNSKPLEIEFLGQATLASSLILQGKPIGGLSGITYDPKRQVYYAISDDRSQKAPARFYTLKIELSQGRLTSRGIKVAGVTTLLDENQKPFSPQQIDGEGIAFAPTGAVWISSEGDAKRLISPFLRSFSLTGQSLEDLPIPLAYQPTSDQHQGIRNNLAFESLAITPDGRSLMTATENALYQDGAEPTTAQGSPCRILRYNLASRRVEGEFVYLTEPLSPPSSPGSSFWGGLGLVDLIAVNNHDRLLSLERSFTPSTGFQVRLFQVSLQGATNIQGQDSLNRNLIKTQKVAQKKLLLNLQQLNFPLDNLEGMALGPKLPDNRQLLILISDNNFSPLQITQVLAFALSVSR